MQAPDCFRDPLLATIPRLRRYARSLVFDSGSADDLVQTALEGALSHWHPFDQRRDLLVWLPSIAHNAFLDQRRRDSRLSILDPAGIENQQDALRSDPGVDVGLRIDLLAAPCRLAAPRRRGPCGLRARGAAPRRFWLRAGGQAAAWAKLALAESVYEQAENAGLTASDAAPAAPRQGS